MIMPGRKFVGGGYRFGFNGMEMDDEVKGNGNSYDFGARIYDPRLGRWHSIDILSIKYPGWSPYNYALNNPIFYLDPDGLDIISSTELNTGGADPTTLRDLGATSGPRAKPIFKKDGSVDVEIQFTITLTKAFKTPAFIKANHPNLREHVLSHEEHHVQQWMETIQEPITIVTDNKTYVGRIDKITEEFVQDQMKIISEKVDKGIITTQAEYDELHADLAVKFNEFFETGMGKIKEKHDDKYVDTRTQEEKKTVASPKEKDAMKRTTKEFKDQGLEEPPGGVMFKGKELPIGDRD